LRLASRTGHKLDMSGEPRIDIQRVKRVLTESTSAGSDWTRRGLSMAASGGANPDLVRNILDGRSKNPTMDTLVGLAAALGKDVSTFFRDGDSSASDQSRDITWVRVVGEVQAGAWRASYEWAEEDQYVIPAEPSPVIGAERFALVNQGQSMNLTFKDGCILDCIRVAFGSAQPIPGDYVIVERRQNDLRETTCKRLRQRDDGVYELVAESTRPEFQQPIVIGKPDPDTWTDDDISVIGIVIGSYAKLFRRR
jgi:SOS-response transcriptional repressor LexA